MNDLFPFPAITADMTEEQKKEAARVRSQSHREATKAVIEFVASNVESESLDDKTKQAMAFLQAKRPRSSKKAEKAPKINKVDAVFDFFANADNYDAEGKVHEFTIFKALKMGRDEIRSALVRQLDAKHIDERLWVLFTIDKETGEGAYSLAQVGGEAPEGWRGYKPLPKRGGSVE